MHVHGSGPNGEVVVQLSGSNAVETIQRITSDTVVSAGMTYNLPGVPIENIVELRGAIRVASGNVKFKVQVRYDTNQTPTSGLGPVSTVIDRSTSGILSDTFKNEQPSAGGFYIIQIVNADVVDLTVKYFYERRFRKYA